MAPSEGEWFYQAAFELDTAESLFNAERYVHAVFRAHLAIEKALKGLYTAKLNRDPPKTHDLFYLINRLSVRLPVELANLVKQLEEAHIITRYPEELDPVLDIFSKNTVRNILDKTSLFLKWTRQQL